MEKTCFHKKGSCVPGIGSSKLLATACVDNGGITKCDKNCDSLVGCLNWFGIEM